MSNKLIILTLLFFAGSKVFADDISKLIHLDCKYDHSKTQLSANNDLKDEINDEDLVNALEFTKKHDAGYYVIVSGLWTRVSHTFYWVPDLKNVSDDDWNKLSKWDQNSWRMRSSGKVVYYEDSIFEKFDPHPTQLVYSSKEFEMGETHHYWDWMENMISRRDGSFYMELSSDKYNVTYVGTCSVIEDIDLLF